MTRCAIRMRQPQATPLSAPRTACRESAHTSYVARTPDTSTSSLFLTFGHLGSSWGERLECSSFAAGTQRQNTRPGIGHRPGHGYTAIQEIHFDSAIGREHRWNNTIETLRGNGRDLGERTSGHAIRRRVHTRRRIAPAFFGSHAASHRARCESLFTCSCPVTPNSVVTDAFPPRSPGGRRSARGFFPAPGAKGRGGNTSFGGTTRSSFLVGGTHGRWSDHRFTVFGPDRCSGSAIDVRVHTWCLGTRRLRGHDARVPGTFVGSAVWECAAPFNTRKGNKETRAQSPWGGCKPGREITKT